MNVDKVFKQVSSKLEGTMAMYVAGHVFGPPCVNAAILKGLQTVQILLGLDRSRLIGKA